MKISVIIPVYNVSKYIERCLLSVLNQTWQDLEIILVDDCTPDNSMEIAYQVVGSHPRGTVVKFLEHEKNRGLSAARNTGIDRASGDYVYFLDSDDYLPDDSFSYFEKALASDDFDFIIGNYKVVGEDRWAPPLFLPTCILEGNENILSAYAHEKWYVMAWNKLINRKFLLEHLLYFREGIVHEDDLWSFKLACMARKMSVVNEVTYFYYMQPHSIMRAPSLFNLECRVAIIGYIYDLIESSDDLKNNPEVYFYFNNLKAKYFDSIVYLTKDKVFRYKSYLLFRKKEYISFFKALRLFHPNILLIIRDISYVCSPRIGYFYFKIYIKISYYFLAFQIKARRLLHYN